MVQDRSSDKYKPTDVSSSSVSLNFDEKLSLLERLQQSFHFKNMVIFAVLIILFVALYWVVFWLPDSVKQPAVIDDAKVIMAQEANKPIDESPWRENQLAKYRRDAQEVLSQVIEKQNMLEDKQVLLWAKEAFSEALNTAESGDYSYRSQEFSLAMQQYQNALKQLLFVEQSMSEKFLIYLEQGKQALINNDSKLARQKLQIAMYLQPEDSNEASSHFDRAIVLDQVLALVKDGDIHIEEQQFELAKSKFEQAYSLDNQAIIVKEQLSHVNQLILDRDFSLTMSSAYKKLQNKEYDQAIALFERAEKIKSNSKTAIQGVKQSKNARLQAQVALLFAQADSFVDSESWQLALESYNEILVLDRSIIKAQVGVITTTARLKLFEQLNNLIEQPERLSHQGVYQQALLVQQDALMIKNPGKKLSQQVQTLTKILARAKVPVAITIESDNQTVVTLHRNGELGKFREKELSLTPGQYTLVGSRDGFRDVRHEFTLVPDNAHQTITIQCLEKVTRG